MYIKRIDVKNFRSCARVRTDMQNGLNVLIGVNGSGKSSFLQALYLLKRIANSQGRNYMQTEESRYESQVAGDIEVDGKVLRFKFDVIFILSERNAEEIVASRQRWNFRELTGVDRWIDLPIEAFRFFANKERLRFVDPYNERRFIFRRYGHNDLPRNIQAHGETLWRIWNYFGSISYYSASQFSDPSKCPTSIEFEEEGQARFGGRSRDHSTFLTALYRAYKGRNPTYQRFSHVIGPEGIGLVERIDFLTYDIPSTQYTVRSDGKLKTKSTKKKVVIPQVFIDKKCLAPSQLSEGTFKTLALLFYLLTDGSSCLLIEEPEVSIHHGLLNSIIEIIKNEGRKRQIILTTHSDYVLDLVEPDQVQLVNKRVDKGTVIRPLTATLSRRNYSALKFYLANEGNLGEYWREGGLDNE